MGVLETLIFKAPEPINIIACSRNPCTFKTSYRSGRKGCPVLAKFSTHLPLLKPLEEIVNQNNC